MKTIPVNGGEKFAIVDDDDYEFLMQWRWYLSGPKGYVSRRVRRDGKCVQIFMHRVIIGEIPEGMMGDHRDGDVLNNTRKNLRPCKKWQNNCNQPFKKNNKLKAKGVIRADSKYLVRVNKHKKVVFHKRFLTLDEAKAAYAEQSRIHHGEFSRS